MRQKQGRRKSSLMKKASEYSKMCNADVCVGIRLRETGQVFILSADASGFWAFLKVLETHGLRRFQFRSSGTLNQSKIYANHIQLLSSTRPVGQLVGLPSRDLLIIDIL
jgi:hypothetical protein